MKGCKYFEVLSDQKALSNIYNITGTRELSYFPEELWNLSEATVKYNFKVRYILGKCNIVVDYLSHHPHWSSTQPIVKDIWGKDILVEAIVRLATLTRYWRKLEDPFLTTIKDVVTEDSDYMTVLDHLKNKTPTKILRKEPIGSPVHSYLNI